MPFFSYEGQRIDYTEFAAGPAALTSAARAARRPRTARPPSGPLILVHGLMLSQEMHRPLAEDLARRGNRVITVDLLGHGDRTGRGTCGATRWHSSASRSSRLMDHLELEQAAVMGTSLGANAALEVASTAPERLRGMVIEMPVLDNGLLASALAFTPLLVALTFGEPVMKRWRAATRAVPRGLLPH